MGRYVLRRRDVRYRKLQGVAEGENIFFPPPPPCSMLFTHSAPTHGHFVLSSIFARIKKPRWPLHKLNDRLLRLHGKPDRGLRTVYSIHIQTFFSILLRTRAVFKQEIWIECQRRYIISYRKFPNTRPPPHPTPANSHQ